MMATFSQIFVIIVVLFGVCLFGGKCYINYLFVLLFFGSMQGVPTLYLRHKMIAKK